MFLAFKARTRAREQQSLPVAVAVSVLAAALTAAARHPSAWPNSPVAPATLRGLALRPRSTLTARPTAAWPPRRQRAARARTPASTTSAGAWSYLPPGPRARTLRQPRPSTQHVVDRLGKMIGRLPLLCAGEQLLGADQEDEHVSECKEDRSILQRQSHQCPVPLLKRLRAQSSHDSVLWTASSALRIGHHAIHVQHDLRQCILALLLAMWACCVAQWPAADENGPLRDHVRENQRHVRTPIHEHRVPRSTQPCGHKNVSCLCSIAMFCTAPGWRQPYDRVCVWAQNNWPARQETDQGSGRRVAEGLSVYAHMRTQKGV